MVFSSRDGHTDNCNTGNTLYYSDYRICHNAIQQLPSRGIIVAVVRQEVYTQLKQHVEWNATIRRTDAVVCLTEQRLEVVQLQILAEQLVSFTVDVD